MAESEKRKKGGQGSVVSDPRFAKLHTDARFQKFPNKERKVEIDDRFKGMLTDERFQHRAPVDKRGRKVKQERKNEDLARYYRLQGEDGAAQTAEAEADRSERAKKDQTGAAMGAAGAVPKQEQAPAASKSMQKAHQQTHAQQLALARNSEAQPDSGLDDDSKQIATRNHAQQGQKHAQLQISASKLRPAPQPEPDSESEPESEEDDEEAAARERWARLRGLAEPETSSSEEDGGASDSGTDAELPSDLDGEEGVDPSEWGVGAMAGGLDEAVPVLEGEGTARLALVDMDWEHVKAVDILMVLRSFLAEGQRVEKVTVYPSDYGMQQMAEEARLGPQSVFGSKARPAEKADANGSTQAIAAAGAAADSDDAESDKEDDDMGDGRPEEDSGSDAEVDQERLRMYERSKLRYYFAVVECADVSTALHLYAQCDGLEFELTANRLDLRFIPDAQSFAGRAQRDTATEAPQGYEPPPAFATAALQHSRVKLTWDATPDERRRAMSRRVRAEELRDDDFKAYLGSDSEGEEQAGQEAMNMEEYRKRLLSGADDMAQRKGGKDWAPALHNAQDNSSGGEDAERQGTDEEGDVDMQVTFDSGLETLGERLAGRKGSRTAETLWQAYEKRRREKRQAAKRLGKHHASSSEDNSDGAASDGEDSAGARADGDPFFQMEADPFSDPFFQGGKEGQKKHNRESVQTASEKEAKRREKEQKKEAAAAAEAEVQRRRAELELLLMDESAALKAKPAFDQGVECAAELAGSQAGTGKLSRKERTRLKKEAKRQLRKAGSDDEDLAADMPAFKAKLDDARFSAIFNNPAFALDPTDPRYSQSAGAQELAATIAKRKMKQQSKSQAEGVTTGRTRKASMAAYGNAEERSGKKTLDSAQLKAMVATLKNRGAQKPGRKAPAIGKSTKVSGKQV